MLTRLNVRISQSPSIGVGDINSTASNMIILSNGLLKFIGGNMSSLGDGVGDGMENGGEEGGERRNRDTITSSFPCSSVVYR